MAATYDLTGLDTLSATLATMLADQNAGVAAKTGSPFAGGNFGGTGAPGMPANPGVFTALRSGGATSMTTSGVSDALNALQVQLSKLAR